ncbi:MAG: aspartate-semialdehyde dehydrogenase [bacterium]|nr:aspartate-semialdehyde dehydrogenase [bacterium]
MPAERICVVGATGAVGREALAILAERGVAPERVYAFASTRSAGAELDYGSGRLTVRALDASVLHDSAAALFCASADVARAFVPDAVRAGVRVVDNSSAYRMDPSVPLVIPEVNGDALVAGSSLAANPNCSTILLLLALEPLRRAFGLSSVLVSTYQAVSGAGIEAIEELRDQTRAVLDGAPPEPRVFREPIAFNVFAHESPVDLETGANEEEAKIVLEAEKIWGPDAPPLFPTCVRVPVERAHSQSIVVELERATGVPEVRAALEAAPGLRLVDDRSTGVFPTPLAASGRDEVLVGRVRCDPMSGGRRFGLWLSGDQLRKGAALNAVQLIGQSFGLA